MKRTLAHIINPVKVRTSSDLYLAQPLTFSSLVNAKFYSNEIDIEQYAVCFPEDYDFVPNELILLPFLKRSVLDLGNFKLSLKLPILSDILFSLNSCSNAEYFIYTNVDIAILPFFYSTVNWIIDQGFDAFVINRRTINNNFHDLDDIFYLYSLTGEKHFGHDCFVFRRDLVENLLLGDVCLGINWVGRVLVWNLIAHSKNFREFTDLHLTFHLGDERRWKRPELNEFVDHNRNEALKILDILKYETDFIKVLQKNYPHLLIGIK